MGKTPQEDPKPTGGNIHRVCYTMTEATRATGFSDSFLYSLMREGKLAFAKIGRRRVIPTAALEKLITDNTQGPRVA